jgi:hypothetical protein
LRNQFHHFEHEQGKVNKRLESEALCLIQLTTLNLFAVSRPNSAHQQPPEYISTNGEQQEKPDKLFYPAPWCLGNLVAVGLTGRYSLARKEQNAETDMP